MLVKIWNQHFRLVFLEEKARPNESICVIMRRHVLPGHSIDCQISRVMRSTLSTGSAFDYSVKDERLPILSQAGSIICLPWLFTMDLWIRGQLCRCYVTSVAVDAVKGNPAVSFFVLPHPRQFLLIRPQTASLLQKKCLLLTICVA